MESVRAMNPWFPYLLRDNMDQDPYLLVEYGKVLLSSLPGGFDRYDLLADYANFKHIALKDLTHKQIDGVLEKAVLEGFAKNRSYFQGVAPLKISTVIE
jgi:hypothetical protein